MNIPIRQIACSWAVLFGSAALLFGQTATQQTQPRTAQPRVQPGQPTQPGQSGQFGRNIQGGAQSQQLEPSILTLLIIDNNKEIALGKLGQQTSEDEHVKHFCEMIVKDHSDFVQKLQERAGSGGRAGLGASTSAGQPTATAQAGRSQAGAAQARTGAAQPADTAAQPRDDATAQRDRDREGQETRSASNQNQGQRERGQENRTAADQGRNQSGDRITVAKPVIGNEPGSQMLQLHQEVAEACLEQARRDASKHNGQQFDTEFIGAQIVAHKGMLDKLQVFERHVSPDTKQLLADAQETTKKHLEEAQNIHEQLGKHAAREGGGRQEKNSRSNRE